MQIRRRNVGLAASESAESRSLRVIKEFDAFPKVPEACNDEKTITGGTVSIVCWIFILILVISEIVYYNNSELNFEYTIDGDFMRPVTINVDLMVAMPCSAIGADVLDQTNQVSHLFGTLEEDDAFFQLSPKQEAHWKLYKSVNSYMNEEYHAIQNLLWTSGHKRDYKFPKRELPGHGSPDSCHLHGVLKVNKVSGNFHVTAGKSFVHPIGHAHLSAFIGPEDYNFSHRIYKFSFGDNVPGIVNPLDGEEKITDENMMMYQYIIKVVPTDVDTRAFQLNTHQYSVTFHERAVNHAQNKHGVPGIYFKYKFTALKVRVTESRKPAWHFLLRLCGIIGGVFSTSVLINIILESGVGMLCRQWTNQNSMSRTYPDPAEKTLLPDLVPQTTSEESAGIGSSTVTERDLPFTDS